MDRGTVVVWKTAYPLREYVNVGITLMRDDTPDCWLIAKGALTLEQGKDSSYTVVSVNESALTEVAPSVVKAMICS